MPTTREIALQIEVFAKIKLPCLGIIYEKVRRTLRKYPSLVHEVGAINNPKRFPNVVIGEENAYAACLQFANDALDFAHGDWVNGGKRFIHQEKFRFGHQRPGNFQTPTLSAGKRVGFLRSHMKELQVSQMAFDHGCTMSARNADRLGYCQDIFSHGKFPKNGCFLW